MCIAICKPAKQVISDERLATCFYNNPDGAGFAYYDENTGHLKVKKGFFKFGKFMKAYRKVCENRRMLIHFRIKTVGEKNEKNCHPFTVGCNSAMIHNGTISSVKPENNMSDSGTLASWLREINIKNPGSAFEPAFIKVLESLVKPSRVAIMTPLKFIILNKDNWVEDDGVLYSNAGFMKAKEKPTYSSTSTQSTYEATFNRCFPLDFTKSSKPGDHYQGMHMAPMEKTGSAVYSCWASIPDKIKEILVKSRDVKSRPHGYNLINHVQDLYEAKTITNLSMLEIESVRDVVINWLDWYARFDKKHTSTLSTGDLLTVIGMMGMTVTECLEQVTISHR